MRKLFFLALAVSLTVSCEKDTPNYSDGTNYYPLEIGNHWIYRHYEMPAEGGEIALFTFDSVFIDQDSILNGNQYFVLKNVRYSTYGEDPDGYHIKDINEHTQIIGLLRDSSGYIVNEEGVIRFAENNFTDTLAYKTEIIDGVLHYTMSMKMEKPTKQISIPIGSFEALNFKKTVQFHYHHGNIHEMVENYMNCYFSNNIGMILDTYMFYSIPGKQYEKRLIRYHVGLDT